MLNWINFKNILAEEISKIITKMDNINVNSKANDGFEQGGVEHLTELKVLDVPTPYGTTTGTHPSVVYFPNSWNGYKFWMAFTPYPVTDRENPCILASNDGENFIVPSGLSNPISGTPETGYNSDTHLVYGPSNKLYCYWRWYNDTSEPNVLWRMESSDGVNWINKTACSIPNGIDPLSPAVRVDSNGKWKLWLGSTGKIKMLKSNDGITFTDMIDCHTNLDDFGYHWHVDMWQEAGIFYCLSAFRSKEEVKPANLTTDLYLGRSDDGVNWEFEREPILFRGQYDLNHYRVYRSSAVRVGREYYLYVSGLGKSSERVQSLKVKINVKK